MQSKAEKELLDQVLKQAEEQEQAEDAAEQVCCKHSLYDFGILPVGQICYSNSVRVGSLHKFAFTFSLSTDLCSILHMIRHCFATTGACQAARGTWWSKRAGANPLW